MITIDFNKKVAVVTGASRGIGAAIALRLAEAGCSLAINYFSNADAAQKIKEKIESIGKKAMLVKADVGNYSQVKKMFEKIISEYKTIDFLINNSGVTSLTKIEEMDSKKWNNVINTNLNGAFYCARECALIMKKNKNGRIINVSSAAAITGRGGGAHYAASKGGMNSLTRAFARELAPHGILVNGVAPAIIETDFYYKRYPTESERSELVGFIPVGRIGKPLDIANICVFLCSDLANFISGETILADGGRTYTGSK